MTILHIELPQGCKMYIQWDLQLFSLKKNAFEDGRIDKSFLCNSSSSSSLIHLKS